MVSKEQIQRINELSKKQRAEGLTEGEKKEQAYLRSLYIDAMKQSLRSQLSSIKVVGPKGYGKSIKKEVHVECSYECESEGEKN